MRQAGRYLPEYNKTRAKAGSFMNLCKTPELACEVTLQPIERYKFDSAILFSDILTIPDALGLGLHFVDGVGPKFEKQINSESDLDDLIQKDPIESLSYVGDAVNLIRKSLARDVPLIGFSGSPWTLACYCLAGGSSRDEFIQIRRWMYSRPDLVTQLLEKLTGQIIDYLQMQIDNGANVIMIFDSWGGLLSNKNFKDYSLKYHQIILSTIQEKNPQIPTILFVKGGGQWSKILAETGCSALGIDWTSDLVQLKKEVNGKCAVQGNLDPAVLLGSEKFIRNEVTTLFRNLKKENLEKGYVFNLGHGISQHTPPENVEILVDAVRNFSSE